MSAAALTKPAFAVIAEFASARSLFEAAEKGNLLWDTSSFAVAFSVLSQLFYSNSFRRPFSFR